MTFKIGNLLLCQAELLHDQARQAGSQRRKWRIGHHAPRFLFFSFWCEYDLCFWATLVMMRTGPKAKRQVVEFRNLG